MSGDVMMPGAVEILAANGGRAIGEADGGSRGNPGVAGFGAVIMAADNRDVLAYRGERLPHATNNVAEWQALIAALQLGVRLGVAHLAVRMDSKLVIEQASGRWQVKKAELQPFHAQAVKLKSRFETVSLTWIPREFNELADGLANCAMSFRTADWQPPAPITARRVEPKPLPIPTPSLAQRAPRRDVPQTVLVQETAQLAVELRIHTLGPDGLAELLIEFAPDRLFEIWGRLPSATWLNNAIASAPIAWARGIADTLAAATV